MPGIRAYHRLLGLVRMAAQEGPGEPGLGGMLFPNTETELLSEARKKLNSHYNTELESTQVF